MSPSARFSLVVASLLVMACISLNCGGGTHSKNTPPPANTSAGNVQQIVVNPGPANNYANGAFTTVSVCVPSSSNCQTISGVLVDTGSYGLRILSAAGGGTFTLSLPSQKGPTGGAVAECTPFVSGYTWGPIKLADVSIAGEHGGNVPVQIIDPTFMTVPVGCKNTGVPADDTLQTLGANAILGIGPFAQDCGNACVQSGTGNSSPYYECSQSSCQVTGMPLNQQVQNPIVSFATDNNGVLLQLPAVTGAQPSVTGSMIFGIGTQSNNGLGNAQVFSVNASGEFNTSYKGQSYPAFVDSGSNAFFFLDATTTGLPTCSDNSGFYCPGSSTALSATTSSGAKSDTINFSLDNADALFRVAGNSAFPSLGGPNSGTFDWGLPFFFGRTVFTAIDGRSTPAGTGPFWAY